MPKTPEGKPYLQGKQGGGISRVEGGKETTKEGGKELRAKQRRGEKKLEIRAPGTPCDVRKKE